MTHEDLITKAIALDLDHQFIEILKSKPLYPIQYTDHDVPEFGKKVVFNGDENTTGMKHGDVGYVLGVARHKPSVGRPVGWMEIVFEKSGNTYVYGMGIDEIDFIRPNKSGGGEG